MKWRCAEPWACAWRKPHSYWPAPSQWRTTVAKSPRSCRPSEWLQARVRISRAASLLCFFALVDLLCAYYLVFADLHGARPW